MQPNLDNPLVTYQYDALNRLIASTPSTQDSTQRFYLKDRLVSEVQGTAQLSIMQHGDQLLAQQKRRSGTLVTGLLATDQQRSVLNVLDRNRPNPLAYTPYGHRPSGNGLLALLGFNGERLDPVTGWYLLGTGHHRPFNPVLGCFICPDSWSPFGEGGLNAYAYCVGDPLNHTDSTGHATSLGWRWVQQNIKFIIGKGPKTNTLGRVPIIPPMSPIKTTAKKNQLLDELASTIPSQQKTIESQQKTIIQQQRIIESTQQKTAQLNSEHLTQRSNVELLRGRISELHADLSTSVNIIESAELHSPYSRTINDVIDHYGTDGFSFSGSAVISANTRALAQHLRQS